LSYIILVVDDDDDDDYDDNVVVVGALLPLLLLLNQRFAGRDVLWAVLQFSPLTNIFKHDVRVWQTRMSVKDVII